jgi:hypothetical protein
MLSLLDDELPPAAPSKILSVRKTVGVKLHTIPDSAAMATYRRRLRAEWSAYQSELAKATTEPQRQKARRAYDDAVANETKTYRRQVV